MARQSRLFRSHSGERSMARRSRISAARFLGTNLSTQLAFRTGIDDVAYGLTSSAFNAIPSSDNDTRRDEVGNLAKGLAVTAKAFEMGLAASVVLPSIRDDPHGAEDDPRRVRRRSRRAPRLGDRREALRRRRDHDRGRHAEDAARQQHLAGRHARELELAVRARRRLPRRRERIG